MTSDSWARLLSSRTRRCASHSSPRDQRAQDLAPLRLKADPDDANALFAMTLSLGMRADYASLIDKHQVGGSATCELAKLSASTATASNASSSCPAWN
jgi:hypothetical protein